SEGRSEGVAPTFDISCTGLSRFVFKRGERPGAALSLGGLEGGIGELEHQLFNRTGVRFLERLRIVGEALTHSGEKDGQRRAQTGRADLDGHGDRFFVEPGAERT